MADISDAELGEIYDFAVQLTKDAGQMLADVARSRMGDNGESHIESQEKDSSVDLVTKADEDVESFVKDAIRKKYPSHKFLGEETYSKSATRDYLVDDAPTWVVDPLDGTVNYTHLFVMYCVSIGFVVKGTPVVGVIYAPMLNQLFSACRGRGAWLNETTRLPLLRNPVPPLPDRAPSGCIFSCEWGKDRRDTPDGNLSRKAWCTAAALDLAYTAAGSFDIWWEGGCWEWDVAAGFAILDEAGGFITTANPPGDPATAAVERAALGGRLYLAIRPAGASAVETGRQAQERVVREVWKRVSGLDYTRPGV